MPFYDYECIECGNAGEFKTGINEMQICLYCGAVMHRKLHSQYGINMGVGAYGYYDETLSTYIGTNKRRKEEMRRQGVTEYGGTPKPTGDAWV